MSRFCRLLKRLCKKRVRAKISPIRRAQGKAMSMKRLMDMLAAKSFESMLRKSEREQIGHALRQQFGEVIHRLFGAYMPGCTYEIEGQATHILHHYEDIPGYYLVIPMPPHPPKDAQFITPRVYYHPPTAEVAMDMLRDPEQYFQKLVSDPVIQSIATKVDVLQNSGTKSHTEEVTH
jgi:hypothetical protein